MSAPVQAPPELKQLGSGDFVSAWGGIAGEPATPWGRVRGGACLSCSGTPHTPQLTTGARSCFTYKLGRGNKQPYPPALHDFACGALTHSTARHRQTCCVPAGLQYGLPATWHQLAAQKLPLQLLSRVWSTFPARLAGLAGRKGAIAQGLDADLVVSQPT